MRTITEIRLEINEVREELSALYDELEERKKDPFICSLGIIAKFIDDDRTFDFECKVEELIKELGGVLYKKVPGADEVR